MIDVKNFSHDIVYENIKNFCILNQISKKSIKYMDAPPIIFEHILIDNKKRELTSTFKISKFNKLYEIFLEYFNEKYSFESKLLPIVKKYDDIFNKRKNSNEHFYKDMYTIENVYYIDLENNIKALVVFNFSELEFSNPYTLILETENSDIIELEKQVVEYYETMFP